MANTVPCMKSALIAVLISGTAATGEEPNEALAGVRDAAAQAMRHGKAEVPVVSAIELFDLESVAMGASVPTSVLLPPGFDQLRSEALPLVVWLHGGGGDRQQLGQFQPWIDELSARNVLPPMVFASFSSTPFSGFLGPWERFIADELPQAVGKRYGTRTDRDGLVIAGMSMGGYGALKSAFRSPESYVAVAAMEPSVEPTLTALPNHTRNTWHRGPAAALGPADNPARQAHDNAAAIRASGLAIYLEVGDEDFLNLHDGTEFVHRVLWDHDIRHEYHLVALGGSCGAHRRKAGSRRCAYSLPRRSPAGVGIRSSCRSAIRSSGCWRRRYGVRPRARHRDALTALLNGPRGPTVHAYVWSALKDAAAGDPALGRALRQVAADFLGRVASTAHSPVTRDSRSPLSVPVLGGSRCDQRNSANRSTNSRSSYEGKASPSE